MTRNQVKNTVATGGASAIVVQISNLIYNYFTNASEDAHQLATGILQQESINSLVHETIQCSKTLAELLLQCQ